MLLTIKSICCKRKILQIYTFICVSVPKHNTCNADDNGKVNVVLCNAVRNYCYCGAVWGISFESFGFESFLRQNLMQVSSIRIDSSKILDCVIPG